MATKNKLTTAKRDKNFSKRLRNTLIGISIIVLIVFLTDKLLFGYVNYYITWLRCGQKPLILNTFSIPTKYIKDGEQGYSVSSMNAYICTEREATQSGYKHQDSLY